MADLMRVLLLGPIEVMTEGWPSGPCLRRKAVLAALALSPSQAISADRLIDIVWNGSAPAGAAKTLQSHVSYLRGLLGNRRAILMRPPGYLLNVGPQATDVQQAERRVTDGLASADLGLRAGCCGRPLRYGAATRSMTSACLPDSTPRHGGWTICCCRRGTASSGPVWRWANTANSSPNSRHSALSIRSMNSSTGS